MLDEKIEISEISLINHQVNDDTLINSQKKFNLLYSDVINCARQIKIYWAICDAKGKDISLKYESFWGWTQQYSCLRLICIEGFKIAEETHKYVVSVLSEVLSNDKIKKLLINSKLSKRLKKLKEISNSLKNYRNKRYAHLDAEIVEDSICDLKELYFALANLDNSLSYISHWLYNSHLDVELEFYKILDAEDNLEKCYFEEYFQIDHTLQACIELLSQNYA